MRLLPLFLLVAALILVFAMGWQRHLSFESLREHREFLQNFVQAHPFAAPIVFVTVYAICTAISLPGASILTLVAGFLFGIVFGASLAVVGATLGAVAVFLIAKTSLGDPLRQRAGPWLERMAEGFQTNAISYLLILRLVPLFPFWLVNLVPAFLGVSISTFAIATFFGIIPGSLVYTSVGNGLGAVLDSGSDPNLSIIFEPQILLPIIGLAILASLPLVHQKLKQRRHSPSQ